MSSMFSAVTLGCTGIDNTLSAADQSRADPLTIIVWHPVYRGRVVYCGPNPSVSNSSLMRSRFLAAMVYRAQLER